MRWTPDRPALLALAALWAGLLAADAAQARGGGFTSSGIGRSGFGSGRAVATRGGSYGSSRRTVGGIGFGPGYGPGFGSAGSRRARAGGLGVGYGAGFGYGPGYGVARGSIERAGIAPSPIMPAAVYRVGPRQDGSARGAASDRRPSAPLLIVIGGTR